MSEHCAQCGHRWVNHGDRAVTACDGGYESLDQHNRLGLARIAVCSCPGWQS